jgi:hypothetical protein
VRHALSLLEFPADQPPVERLPGDLASEPVPRPDRFDFECCSAVPS